MSVFIRCFTGPRLYRLYRNRDQQGHAYEGSVLESGSDSLFKTMLFSMSMAWSLGVYACPIVAAWMYKKGYFTTEGMHGLFRFSGAIGCVLLGTLCVRGIGRMMNSDYLTFLSVLDAYKRNVTRNLKNELSRYDFEFNEWPVDFRWNDTAADTNRQRQYIEKVSSNGNSMLENMKNLPCRVLSFFAIHSFGRRMIYPGSIKLIHMLLSPMLLRGRAKLIEDYGGERFKLLTREDNEIDSVFIDRRNNKHFPNGNTLVICCEGNSGFYEYGITVTPIEAGYSVLGWNHPGFAGSTGIPFPDQETNAVDVVMQFAIKKLGFKPEEITLYAWSIGGFSATWAAMNYPDIKGLILDATFDDLVALAVARMFPSWRPLVVRTVRDYMDLNIAAHLCRYSGPVLLIRRTKDEMISTIPSRSIQTNRGNNLLIKLLRCRYPKLVTDDTVWALDEWVSGDKSHQTILWSQQEVEEELCHASIASYIEENSLEFPMLIGEDMPNDMRVQLILYLASKHMIDFQSTHCVPLPARVFQFPWDHVTSNSEESSDD